MKHIREALDIRPESFKSLSFYLDNSRYAILDIETTGLSPINNAIILIGLVIVEGDDVTLNQFFALNPDEEEEILPYALKELSGCKYLVTFNGRFFDVPFFEKRALRYGKSFPWLFNLDLYYLLKSYSDLPKIIPKMNQKTIERYAGIEALREDRISGGESVNLYNQYLETGSKDLEKRIILHNNDDLKQLIRLTSLIKNANIHKAFYKTGFPIMGGRVTGIEIKKGDIIINGKTHSPVEYISFPSPENPYTLRMSGKTAEFTIDLPYESRAKDLYLNTSFIDDAKFNDIISVFPSFINNHLIIKEGDVINYLEVNLLAKKVSEIALIQTR